MATRVDARGFSCPQPVLMTLDEIKKRQKGEIEVLVDTDTSKENVSRAAASQGWQIKDIQPEGEGYKVFIAKD
jgi:tRNA 2-thiouridine synthesizing protein A